MLAQYLNVTAASNFAETFLTLEGFIHLIVGHAEHAQLSLIFASALRKHHKVRHERYDNGFGVQLGCHGNRITWCLTIDQPEPVTSAATWQPFNFANAMSMAKALMSMGAFFSKPDQV